MITVTECEANGLRRDEPHSPWWVLRTGCETVFALPVEHGGPEVSVCAEDSNYGVTLRGVRTADHLRTFLRLLTGKE